MHNYVWGFAEILPIRKLFILDITAKLLAGFAHVAHTGIRHNLLKHKLP